MDGINHGTRLGGIRRALGMGLRRWGVAGSQGAKVNRGQDNGIPRGKSLIGTLWKTVSCQLFRIESPCNS